MTLTLTRNTYGDRRLREQGYSSYAIWRDGELVARRHEKGDYQAALVKITDNGIICEFLTKTPHSVPDGKELALRETSWTDDTPVETNESGMVKL